MFVQGLTKDTFTEACISLTFVGEAMLVYDVGRPLNDACIIQFTFSSFLGVRAMCGLIEKLCYFFAKRQGSGLDEEL